MSSRPIIAIDIDDVIADTREAVRLWANAKAELDLERSHYETPGEYWYYYDHIWATHGVDHIINLDHFLQELVTDQARVPLLAGAEFAINELRRNYEIVLITARPAEMEKETRRWLSQAFDDSVSMYFSNNPFNKTKGQSKGELCVDLGATLLIDDNCDHVQSALDNGVEAILFGTYGWQPRVPEGAMNCPDWPAVLEYLDARAK